MKRNVINTAMIELRAAINEAEELSGKAELSKRDESRINVLLAKIASLRQNAVAPNDYAQRWMTSFLRGTDLPVETRTNVDFLAGTQSISYTEPVEGGYLVPNEFHDELILGIAQADPLLNPELVTIVESDNFSLRPYSIPGVDLSTFAAAIVAEGNQQNPLTIPAASGKIENGYKYGATLDASFEFEQDAFQPTLKTMQAIWAAAFARGIGADLISGNGTSAPQGVLTGATDSGITTAGPGAITADDIEAIYFSVDAAYRSKPKFAWLMNDTVYKFFRKAKDSSLRPLINVVDDKMWIMGKPVLICPTLSSTAGQRGIVIGDLAHYVVRVSRMAFARNLQAAGYVEKGKGLYTAYVRADAKVIDPTGGGKPPIVYATLHS